MNMNPPVKDWVNDWDHTDPQWTEDPFPIWDQLRSTSPIVHTDRFLGCYLPTTYEAVRAIANDSEHFSSRRIIVRSERSENLVPAPPITSDPPYHKPAKQLLLPPFTPDAMKKLEPRARAICNELIDKFINDKTVDAAAHYSKHIPVRVIAHMLGVPSDDGDRFRHWIHLVLEVGISDESVILPTVKEMNDYFQAEIEKRRAQPGEDLISYLLNARIDGQPLSPAHVVGSLRLLLIAGIDTTWSAIGSSLWHLATHPEDRRRLAADESLLPTAIEEFLRAYAPVTMAREVVKDTVVGGCTFHEKGQVLLSFPAANRDPAVFPDADRVLIDRAENRHAAFGLGRHRCLGSNLARMEMTVAIREWLARFPEFRLAERGPVTWSEGTVRGPRRLPVVLN